LDLSNARIKRRD